MSAGSFADTGEGRVKGALLTVAVREMTADEAVLPINEGHAMNVQYCFRDGHFRGGDSASSQARTSRQAVDPSLERLMRCVVLFGTLLVIALPTARGNSHWFGALPLWLIGMPLASWWALHRFHMPLRWAPANRHAGSKQVGAVRRRAGRPQARRRTPISGPRQRGIPRVA